MPTMRRRVLLLGIAWGMAVLPARGAEDEPATLPWDAVKTYQYGQDLQPLLRVERAAYRALAEPAQQGEMAERLLAVLGDAQATEAGRQFAALQLRTVARAAEVPKLEPMLTDALVGESARQVLEAISGAESLSALRAAVPRLQGTLLVGVLNSLGARRDPESLATLIPLTTNRDPAVAAAAVRAIEKIGGPAAVEALAKLQSSSSPESSLALTTAYLHAVESLVAAGKQDEAAAAYRELSARENPPAVRQAALLGQLSLAEDRFAMVRAWLAGADDEARALAARELPRFTEPTQTRRLLEEWATLPVAGRALLLEALAERLAPEALPLAVEAAGNAEVALRLAGVQSLAFVGESEQVPLLVQRLGDEEPRIALAAKDSLARLSAEGVDQALLVALKDVDEARRAIVGSLLADRGWTLAVPALLEDAAAAEPQQYRPALLALRALGTPEDAPALLKLLLATEKGTKRDEIEKTIALLGRQIQDQELRAQSVLAAMAELTPRERLALLPLLGRIGGSKAHDAVAEALASPDAEVQEAGIRALCNWPDASVAEQLWHLAQVAPKRELQVGALRAYIRVVSLPSERPATETLALLQKAMLLATEPSEQKLVLHRASAARTVETLRWAVPYLDDPVLGQEACRTVVELAHHRFVMYPNRAEFLPALEKVVAISKDRGLVDRAKKYLQRQ